MYTENEHSTVNAPPPGFLRGHIPALDGIRGCAAAMVFILHYGGGAQSSWLPVRLLGEVIKFGWSGVSLFFVLSGFLISGILWDSFQRPGWWKRFYIRRSLRIFPLYYLAILIAAVAGLYFGSSLSDLHSLWTYVFYLRNVPTLITPGEPLGGAIHLGHLWSLAVEEQFYLVWPFLLVWFAGRRHKAMRMILGLWVLSFFFRLSMLGLPQGMRQEGLAWSMVFLFGRAGELLAGTWLALAVRGNELERQQLFRALPAVLAASFTALVTLASLVYGTSGAWPWMSTIGLSLFGILFTSLVGSALQPGIIQSVFALPVLRWLGKISYGIYIYHLLFGPAYTWITNRIAPNLGHNAHLVLQFIVAMVGTLAAASLSYYTFESAFLHWKDRIEARGRMAAIQSVAQGVTIP